LSEKLKLESADVGTSIREKMYEELSKESREKLVAIGMSIVFIMGWRWGQGPVSVNMSKYGFRLKAK